MASRNARLNAVGLSRAALKAQRVRQIAVPRVAGAVLLNQAHPRFNAPQPALAENASQSGRGLQNLRTSKKGFPTSGSWRSLGQTGLGGKKLQPGDGPQATGGALSLRPAQKSGFGWLRKNKSGPALADWYKDSVRMKRKDWGAAFSFGKTPEEFAREDRREALRARGKTPTRKHEGKQKGKKKR
jgi:hypothetical protein